jgi:hypothetical protein
MLGARVVVAVLVVAGCGRTFQGTAVQPNPVAHPTETLRNSEPIRIVTGDMELEEPDTPAPTQSAAIVHNHRYPLINEASFTIVSRDRLRFHVQVDHKWEEYADLTTWDAHLEDDQGHTWVPESVENAHTKIMTRMWDREQRTVIRNQYGDPVHMNEDGWKRRQSLGSLSVYRGNADFVFYQRDMFTQKVKWLKLVITRSGHTFEFLWRFEDTVASE